MVWVFALAALISGCGGSGSGASGKKATLEFAVFSPFTGPDAVFGTVEIAGCVPATILINQAGGVLGHQVHCTAVDTRGDPADAVPAARQLLATASNLAGVIGPSADEATATVPSFERAHVTMFITSGQAAFDRSGFRYVWRVTPADDLAGYAMAAWAHKSGYTRAGAAFGNDISAQGSVASLLAGTKKLGITLAVNLKILPAQSSYRSEILNLLASHPQVIFDEMDPQTSATFFGELKTLNGHMLPAIGADPTLTPDWFKAVAKVIGKADLIRYVSAENPSADFSGPAWQAYNAALLKSGSQVPSPSQYSSQSYTEHIYDAVNIMALAMLKAGNTNPKQYNSEIVNVTAPRAGAVVVTNYADGKRALAAGKQIQYVGPGGLVLFDQWHNSPGSFAIERWNASAGNVTVGALTAAEIAAAH